MNADEPGHEERYDERRIRAGLVIMGVVLVVAVVLLIVVNDPIGRFIFGFVVLVCLVQLWRLGRLMRRLQ